MGRFAGFYQHVLEWANFGSIHGLHHALYSSYRNRLAKLFWSLIVLTFAVSCCYLQISLLYEILVKKPILVKSEFERVDSINFPNVVVCDLNQEFDKVLEYLNMFGNSAEMHRLLIQLSQMELFTDFRSSIRRNITSTLMKYPMIAEDYHKSNQKCDPLYLEKFGKISDCPSSCPVVWSCLSQIRLNLKPLRKRSDKSECKVLTNPNAKF